MRLLVLTLTIVCLSCAPAPTLMGVPRLELVDVERNVWRSAQPETPAEWATIKDLGVKRDVVLRTVDEWPVDSHDAQAAALGIAVYEIPMSPSGFFDVMTPPVEYDVERAVSVMELGDVLVHCRFGQDRTGFVVARYKVEALGWSKAAAWNEALDRGLHWELLGLNYAAQDWLEFP